MINPTAVTLDVHRVKGRRWRWVACWRSAETHSWLYRSKATETRREALELAKRAFERSAHYWVDTTNHVEITAQFEGYE